MTSRRSPQLVLALASLLVVASAGTSNSWAGETADRLQSERARAEDLEARGAEAERELADIGDELVHLEKTLADAQADLAEAERVLEDADVAARVAMQALEAAQHDLLAAERDLADNEAVLGSMARETYMYGRSTASPQLAAFDLLATSDDADAFAAGMHYLSRGLDARAAALEESVALRAAVEQMASIAEQRGAEARREASSAEALRDDAAVTHAEVDGLLALTSVEQDRHRRILDELEFDQADAASTIEALENRLEDERAEQRRREQEAQAGAAASRPSGGSGPQGGLVQVEGITVAASLGPALEQLLADARADGIVLSGSGWRSSEVQAALRRTNGCPDIYDSPASSCRVPTARPGTSEHEKGLAVDFTWQGRTICFPYPASACRGNAAFDWLQANAARYGLFVLSSEAWHWSTTGR